MEIITKKIADLNPAPFNPRCITDEALAGLTASIREYGCVEPIIWNKHTGHIVGGHQRLKALKQQGIDETEVVVVDLSLEKEKALNVALNNRHIQGDWTTDLRSLLKEIEVATPDLYAGLNLEALVADIPVLEAVLPEDLTELDNLPETPKEVFIQMGDLVSLGKHRLLCGDATQPNDVQRLLSGQTPILCLTDPPYCVDYENIKRRADEPTRKERGDAYEDPEDPRELLKFIDLIPGDVLVMTFPVGKHFQVLAEATKNWDLMYDCVWVKNVFAFNMRRRYQQQHEMILIFRKTRHKTIGAWNVPNNQSTVFEFDKPAANKEHPTMKPVGLYLLLVQYHSNPGDLIYEPFCGSGTTLIAAEQTKRICHAMELKPQYVQVSTQRWIELTGKRETVTVEREGKLHSWMELQLQGVQG
ncbi:MAG: DNA modification methylase [Elusimicrobia bacterium]|nr:DNA modification methylase [Elusimicrobiota bacterium]